MKLIFQSPTTIHINLSRRNVVKLLELIDRGVGIPVLQKRLGPDQPNLIISAEPDESHYSAISPVRVEAENDRTPLIYPPD